MSRLTKKQAVKLSLVALLIAVIAIFAAVSVWHRSNSYPATKNEVQSTGEPVPLFSFARTSDWREGPSNETSLALFGKQRKDGTSACFTSAEYKSGTVDVNAALQKQEGVYAAIGNTMTLVTTITNTLQTSSGEKQYDLH